MYRVSAGAGQEFRKMFEIQDISKFTPWVAWMLQMLVLLIDAGGLVTLKTMEVDDGVSPKERVDRREKEGEVDV